MAVPVVKLNSYDISSMAPTLAKLVENSELDLNAVNSMMLDKVQNSLTREQAACAWLKSNEARCKATWLEPSVELSNFRPFMVFVDIHTAMQVLEGSFLVSQCVSSTIGGNYMHY